VSAGSAAAETGSTRFVVGLTGGIGSGKSAAAEEFARLGAGVVDTDAIAHELTAAGGAAIPAIERLFGKDVLLGSGAMDRDKVRARVFADPAARKALEALLHPLIRSGSAERIAAAPGPYVVHVVPLLVESKDYRLRFDRVLVIDASEETQIARVRGRGLADDEIHAILHSQAGRRERLAAADDVIANDGTLDALRQQVAALHAKYAGLAARAGS
jgi:dephospho-CoA kinase